jgi:hypothetical protein
MVSPRLSTAALRPAFVPEWCALAVMALVEIAWARAIGLHMTIGPVGLATPPVFFLLVTLLRGLRQERAALFFEYGALSLVGSFGLVVLSYLCMASAGAPADAMLQAFDRALGFDWLGTWHWIAQFPALMRGMEWSYDSLLVESFYITILLGIRGNAGEMRDLWRLSTIACALSCLIAILLPALGPYKLFGLDAQGPFLPAMEQLLARHDLNFDAGALRGVIGFPSIHTVLALSCSWALRRMGALFWIFVVVNAAMLFTIPFMGGHYLADMIGGAAVTLVSLGIVVALPRRAAALAEPVGTQAPVMAPC